MNSFLYDAIRDACTTRIEKGEEYSFDMWFEEAESLLQYCKEHCLVKTAKDIEKIIEEQRKFLKE